MRVGALLLLLAFVGCKPAPSASPPDTGIPPCDGCGLSCGAYESAGTVYNCDTLDRCDASPENLAARLACCTCDSRLCAPDPSCPYEGNDDDPVFRQPPPVPAGSSCMTCHNGATTGQGMYSGPGIENPHPFGSAGYLDCTDCHGGNSAANGMASHVPEPPQLREVDLVNDPTAYFNLLTATGVDRWAPYTFVGSTWTALDWIQFRNPGDLRVVSQGRGCGASGCHVEHAGWSATSPIGTQAGLYSKAMYATGSESFTGNPSPGATADLAFRALTDATFVESPATPGRVRELLEFPEYARFEGTDPNELWQNPGYTSASLDADVHDGTVQVSNRVIPGSLLERLVMEVIALGCGDCHAGSNGPNHRYGDFRSSGCTSCHMPYAPDGVSRSRDPNVRKDEPRNPDAIAAPERPHPATHQLRSVARIRDGAVVRPIDDQACVGCHQGSNRTVLQYWGIRLDGGRDVTRGLQYPSNPVTLQTTAQDPRVFDPGVANVTFNGRVPDQLLLFEDYDGDGRDDTPSDVHYDAGMGCVDCHGSADLHGGAAVGPTIGIRSHQDQVVAVQCQSCHGDIDDPPPTVSCVEYEGRSAECAADRMGRPLRHVTRDADGHFWLRSKLSGQSLYVPLTRDVVHDDPSRVNPLTGEPLFSPLASYAMGRIDDDASNGVGPRQQNPNLYDQGFAHQDSVDCVTCHAAWSNTCVGCHLAPAYNADPANFFFSNTTGERIALDFAADFTYQSPVMFALGVGPTDRITHLQPGMSTFFRYTDLNGDTSRVFAFSDREGGGNDPDVAGRGLGALAHNRMMPHSVRGAVDANNEGPRYCNACHLTADMDFDAYTSFKTAYANRDYASLDYPMLASVIGQGTNNAQNSAIWVHMVSGQGSGLFAFDANGCPVNPLDANANRPGCGGVSPAELFAIGDPNARVVYDLDRIVEPSGVSNASNSRPMEGASTKRTGSRDPFMSGPLGIDLLERLTNHDAPNGLVLDSWIDDDANLHGAAAQLVP